MKYLIFLATRFLTPWIPFAVLTTLAEGLAHQGLLPSYLFPAPSSVFASLIIEAPTFGVAIASTFRSAAFGLVLSCLLGVLVGVCCSLSVLLKRMIYPIVLFFQTVPIVAIAPVLIIWFGFGESTARASSFIVAWFPVVASTMAGIASIPREQRELFQILKASRWNLLLRLEIPGSLNMIFNGFQVAAGLSIIGAIVGEFVAGGGLGGLIDSALAQQRLEIVFGAVLLATLMGLMLTGFLGLLRRILSQWRPLFPS